MNMSDSVSERSSAEDDWDDMAIVRAFEDALADKRSGSRGGRANGAKRNGKEKRSPAGERRDRAPSTTAKQEKSNGATTSSYAPISSGYQYDSAAYQANDAYNAAQTPFSATDPYQQHYHQFQQQQQHQQQQQYQATPSSTANTYQEAYAQAYAAIMAQVQAATTSSSAFTSFPPQVPMGMYGMPPPPSFPSQSNAFGQAYGASIPTPPFPGAAEFTPAAQMRHGHNVGDDDGLANLLLAWYQSGYYTGRFQMMQEMKSRPRR